jgi:hypothetical protein
MWRNNATVVVALSLLGLAACSSASVMLVQPRTGARIECSASGWGIMAPAAPNVADECVRNHERDGYVPVEKLTPGERADLERRGVLTPAVEQRPSMY